MRTDLQRRPHRVAHDRGRHLAWCPQPAHTLVPRGERACCCPATAVYAIVVTEPDGAAHTPVLLCHHHARIALPALDSPRTTVFDVAGQLLDASLIRM